MGFAPRHATDRIEERDGLGRLAAGGARPDPRGCGTARRWPGQLAARPSGLPEASGTFHVPRALVSLASVAIQAREPDRFGLLYSLVWRVNAGEKLLEDETDPDLSLARRMALAVRADAHRMRTAMRFLPVAEEDGRTRFLGWFEPAHFVLPANAQLIARRHPELVWSIVTPDGAAHWDGSSLLFGSGLRHAADDEALQAWWERHRRPAVGAGDAGGLGSGGRGVGRGPSPARPARAGSGGFALQAGSGAAAGWQGGLGLPSLPAV